MLYSLYIEHVVLKLCPGLLYRCYMTCVTKRTTTAVTQNRDHVKSLSFHFLFQCLQQHSTGSWCACCWIWNLRRPRLLAGQELLGDQLGNAGLHHDVQEQKQPVWNCHEGQLSTSLSHLHVQDYGYVPFVTRLIQCVLFIKQTVQ